jgi:hypothetical protein
MKYSIALYPGDSVTVTHLHGSVTMSIRPDGSLSIADSPFPRRPVQGGRIDPDLLEAVERAVTLLKQWPPGAPEPKGCVHTVRVPISRLFEMSQDCDDPIPESLRQLMHRLYHDEGPNGDTIGAYSQWLLVKVRETLIAGKSPKAGGAERTRSQGDNPVE